MTPRKTLLAAPAALAATALFLLAPSAGAVGRYADPTGDSGGAPDITGVSVASDPGGQILFTINVANLPSPAEVQTLLFLNTDGDPNTGMPDSLGADYVFVVDESDNTYGFLRWTGAEWSETPFSTVSVRSSSTSVTVSVNRSELGSTTAFNFWARTIQGDARDTAPELGAWNYSLQAGGPDVQAALVQTQPSAGPRAGRPFTVTPVALRLPATGDASALMPKPERYSCTAKLAGKRLAGRGTGGCTFNVPKNAKRKALVVTVTVSYQGASKSFLFAYRVA